MRGIDGSIVHQSCQATKQDRLGNAWTGPDDADKVPADSHLRTATVDHNPAPTPLSQLPARDPVAALACAGGDADLADELFAALLDGLPTELDALQADLDRADWAGVADHAHQLRGATRYCGVPALEEASETLERAACGGDPGLIAQAFADLSREAVRVREAAL
jgi:two-component system sensor histidine kinase BarA